MSARPGSRSGRSSSVPSAWCSAPGPLGISDTSRYGPRTTPIGVIVNVLGRSSLIARSLARIIIACA